MFCYIWSYAAYPDKCKFGERWVKEGQDPEKEVLKRVREQLSTSKYLLDSGEAKIDWFGDVTEYAKKFDRCYMHGKVDDHIRAQIGFRTEGSSEFHDLPADEMIIRVNKLLSKVGQPLPIAGLSTAQYNIANNVIEAIHAGKRTILAELCARFGKTIWSGAMIRETNASLTVVASYVLTSFSSFIKDLTSFEQFKDLVHVDTKDDDYQEQINAALADGKQVVAYVSMCKGSKRDDRIEFLYSTEHTVLTVIDEADYGVHKAGQAGVLIENIRPDDVTILMTGTNSDRAAGEWNPDHFVSVTYPELLIEKALTLNAV